MQSTKKITSIIKILINNENYNLETQPGNKLVIYTILKENGINSNKSQLIIELNEAKKVFGININSSEKFASLIESQIKNGKIIFEKGESIAMVILKINTKLYFEQNDSNKPRTISNEYPKIFDNQKQVAKNIYSFESFIINDKAYIAYSIGTSANKNYTKIHIKDIDGGNVSYLDGGFNKFIDEIKYFKNEKNNKQYLLAYNDNLIAIFNLNTKITKYKSLNLPKIKDVNIFFNVNHQNYLMINDNKSYSLYNFETFQFFRSLVFENPSHPSYKQNILYWKNINKHYFIKSFGIYIYLYDLIANKTSKYNLKYNFEPSFIFQQKFLYLSKPYGACIFDLEKKTVIKDVKLDYYSHENALYPWNDNYMFTVPDSLYCHLGINIYCFSENQIIQKWFPFGKDEYGIIKSAKNFRFLEHPKFGKCCLFVELNPDDLDDGVLDNRDYFIILCY